MDSRCFLALSLCFLIISPHLPRASAQISGAKRKKGDFDPTRVIQLSWRPRAFMYTGFLSPEECDHLIELAKDKLEKSMVVHEELGKSVESEIRTSSGMFLDKQQDEVVADIEARIAVWTFLPVENGESLQILHYEDGQKYETHHDTDSFDEKKDGGYRVATVIMYLSDVESGGETVFPNSEVKFTEQNDDTWSECAKEGRAVKPRKGDALLFFSLHPNATTIDDDSLHESCPVIKGEKWSATKWIHVRSYDD